MQRILFLVAALACANDAKFAAQPAVPAARLMQLEEELETAEAHRDVKKAYVKAAEVGMRIAESNWNRLVKLLERAVISKEEVEAAKLELEAAKAQVDIRMAELKEAEVKVKYAKKRLDAAKGGGIRPLPNPVPNARSTELRIKIDLLIVEAVQSGEKVKRAGLAQVVAEQSLEKLREVAKVGRLQAGTIERAEAVVAETRAQVAKLSAERKALDAEIDTLREKLREIEK